MRPVTKLRTKSFEAKFESFCSFSASLYKQLGEMEALAKLARKFGSGGEIFLQVTLAAANSDEGAYCWVGRAIKWKEFLKDSKAQLEDCEEQFKQLDLVEPNFLPLKEIKCTESDRLLGLSHSYIRGRFGALFDESYVKQLQEQLDGHILVLWLKDGS